MAKKPKKILSAEELGIKLGTVRKRMAADDVLNTNLTKAFKEALIKEGKREAGNYRVRKDYKFNIAVEELAMQFALQRGLVKIDTGKVKKVFVLDEALRFSDPLVHGFENVSIDKVVPVGDDRDEE